MPVVAGQHYCAAATKETIALPKSHGTGLREGDGGGVQGLVARPLGPADGGVAGGDRGVAELVISRHAAYPVFRSVELRRGLACSGDEGGEVVNTHVLDIAAPQPWRAPRHSVV